MSIIRVTINNLEEITDLHLQNLPYTSSKIGKDYLKSLYKSIIVNPQTHLCLAAIVKGKIIGLISGTNDLKKTQKILRSNLSLKAYVAILTALLSFKVTPIELIKQVRLENVLTKKFTNPYPTILTFFVDENYRRKGIGKKLVAEYLKNVKGRKKKIYVDTKVKNKNAQKFYTSIGFKKIDRIIDSFVFEKFLSKRS